MGHANRQILGQWLRVWLAGTVIALAPLLLLEDLDFLLRELAVSPMLWPAWASIPISGALGAVAAVAVGLRRRWEEAACWEVLAQRVARYTLFWILSLYALSKILRTQFRVPYVTLDTPLGDVSDYMLAWRFFGYSHGHEWFVALGEWLGPALLLGWRTTTLGACLTAAVLALTAYLLLLDGRRLLGFFLFNQPVPPRPRPAALIRTRWLSGAAKAGWVALALAYASTYLALGDTRPTPIAGAWTVAPAGDHQVVPWHTVYFERGVNGWYVGSIRREAGAAPERFRYECDAADRHLRMTFVSPGGAERTFDGEYEVQDDGRLRLRGVLGERRSRFT